MATGAGAVDDEEEDGAGDADAVVCGGLADGALTWQAVAVSSRVIITMRSLNSLAWLWSECMVFLPIQLATRSAR
ncbi:hypothetical protein NITHO_2700004 [Nitrolancea hollandica Lb]|uniref:Uncharacterized protein n=1 Tax=Nitrolancea hollandica Lb TaxID=1129897 RepID=I4EGG3_9BACT|nr:hypothetical protein NITHO_2700004 [Nitrolancea hollandica Lb]